ncbi:HK97-gp10 family putative phage morphogenesis protein [Microbispora sp. CA-102843]|uniref:HK97-gp10 family putative phage morphogenesis protein n=1 Tax=Microbispora sp. CA-102843 TaxID=3239952 RepID=UPI003D91FB2B
MAELDFEGIEVINRLAFDLGRLGLTSITKVARVVRSTGERTVAGAQAIVPVRTGNLKNSIGVDFDPDGLGFEAGPTASYAPYVEWGTSRMAPRAFLGPAFDRAIADGVEALEEVLGRDLL